MDLQAQVMPNLPNSGVIRDDLAEQIGSCSCAESSERFGIPGTAAQSYSRRDS
jgi:hypothetical protein